MSDDTLAVRIASRAAELRAEAARIKQAAEAQIGALLTAAAELDALLGADTPPADTPAPEPEPRP